MNCCLDPHHGPHVHVSSYQWRDRREDWSQAKHEGWFHLMKLLYHFGITVIY